MLFYIPGKFDISSPSMQWIGLSKWSKNEKKIKLVKGGIMSEYTGRFVLLQKDIPNLYPKLLHPETGFVSLDVVSESFVAEWNREPVSICAWKLRFFFGKDTRLYFFLMKVWDPIFSSGSPSLQTPVLYTVAHTA